MPGSLPQMLVAILCGGRGTRLQEHSPEVPKPLVEIGGHPILWHVVRIYAALARGSWPRRAEGIHDATHLRWFTLRDAIALCEGAGLRVEHVEKRPWLLWRGTRLDRFAPPLSPFTFQHVLAGRRMARP